MMLDINLLPKKSKSISSQLVTILILVGAVFVVVAGFFGVLMPLQKKNELNNKISEVKYEIEKYNVSDAEYYQLLNYVDNKRMEGEALLYLRNNRLDITDCLDNIEESMPVDTYLNTLELSGPSLNIIGISKDYRNISKFIVKLRGLDNLYNTTFTTATLDKGDQGEDDEYEFTIYNDIVHRDIIGELQGVDTFTQQPPVGVNSKGGEVAQ